MRHYCRQIGYSNAFHEILYRHVQDINMNTCDNIDVCE